MRRQVDRGDGLGDADFGVGVGDIEGLGRGVAMGVLSGTGVELNEGDEGSGVGMGVNTGSGIEPQISADGNG